MPGPCASRFASRTGARGYRQSRTASGAATSRVRQTDPGAYQAWSPPSDRARQDPAGRARVHERDQWPRGAGPCISSMRSTPAALSAASRGGQILDLEGRRVQARTTRSRNSPVPGCPRGRPARRHCTRARDEEITCVPSSWSAPSGNQGLEKFLDRRGPGLHHVCFEVEDPAAAAGGAQGRRCGLSTRCHGPARRAPPGRVRAPARDRRGSCSSS